MSDKDFVVKNGLVVNTTFTANATEVHIGNSTVNAVFTSPTSNKLTLTLSNSTANGTLTSANYSGTSANSTLLNNQPGSYYTNATNINAGTLAWAYQAANTVNTTGNFWMTGNLNFTAANTYFGNDTVTPTVFFNTINATSNGVTVNSSLIVIGNSSVNQSINSTAFSGSANNALNLGGQPNTYFTNATNMASGILPYARLGPNVVNTTGTFTVANLTVNSQLTVTNGTVSTVSNSSGLYALAGNVKSSYIESTALANLAYANITGNTWVGGDLNVTGVLTVSGTTTIVNAVSIATKDKTMILATDSINNTAADGAGIKVANLTAGAINYEFASLTYRSADDTWNSNQDFAPSSNATLNLGTTDKYWNILYANTLYGTLASPQPGITVGDSLKLGNVAAAFYIQNSDSRVLSGNLNFTGANVYFGNNSIPGSARFGNLTVVNTTVNTSSITLGGTGTSVGNVAISYSGLITGNNSVTSNSVLWISNTAGNTQIGANGGIIGGNAFQVGTTVYVTSDGNTGIGTGGASIDAKLEVSSPFGISTSNTLFLYQNSATSTISTWNAFRFITTESANKDYTFRQFNVGPSGIGIGYAPPTAAKASSDALYVAGNTGFNTSTPRGLVDINGDLITTAGANIGGALTVSGGTSVSNGLTNQILTATGTGSFAPYWSSNVTLINGNITYFGTNSISTVIPPATYTFTGNSTGLSGNVKVFSIGAWTGSVTTGTGTITVAGGTSTITGAGTLFTQLSPGTVISFTNLSPSSLNTYYTIKSIQSDTSMTMTSILPSVTSGSPYYIGGLDNRSRIYVPGIAGLLQTGDKLIYSVASGNTAISGINTGYAYNVIWGNNNSFALADSAVDPLLPIAIASVTATAQPGHYFTIDYSSSIRIGNNAAGAGIVVIGNTTVNATINSTAFSGSANNLLAYPLNQSVNTTSNPTFNTITSSNWIRAGGSGSNPSIIFGSTATSTKNLAFTSLGGIDTLNFQSSGPAVLQVNGSVVITNSNYSTYVTALPWSALTGTAPAVSTFTNDVKYANSTNGFGINGNASTATNASQLNGQGPSYYLTYGNLTGVPTNLNQFTNGPGYLTSSTGVSGLTAGTGVSVSGSTGSVTVSIGQPVATTSAVTFGSVTTGSVASGTGTFTTSGSISTVTITDTGGNGANLKFAGNGATTPNKFIRALNGQLQIVNNAYNGVPFVFDDAGNFTASQNITAYSDQRLKSNIETIIGSLDLVCKLRGVRYTRDDNDNKAGVGVIAQEIKEVLPEVVHENIDGMLSVSYGNIVGVLIEAIKELKSEVEELKRNR